MTSEAGGYRLGIDVGTTYTAAAVLVDGRADVLGLGNRALQVPSVLYFKEDGTVLIGEAAEARGAADPSRLVREFKRRIGDPVPILVAGSPQSPQSLLARMLTWVVETATQSVGSAPAQIVVTHPANWGPYKKDLHGQALRLAGLTEATTATEPEAAAIAFASRNRMADQDAVVVFDLGGGTLDVAVLRRSGDRFETLGQPEGIEHLGGVDFDEALFRHVLAQLPGQLSDLDADDPDVRLAVARLRRDTVAAKEALSADTETIVPVTLPGMSTTVRLTRGEFEAMIAPTLTDSVGAVRRALSSAGLHAEDIASFVLVGGSSRIPLVSESLVAEFGRPVVIDTHPKHDVALGAALTSIRPQAGATAEPAAAAPTSPPPAQAPPEADLRPVATAGLAAAAEAETDGAPVGPAPVQRPPARLPQVPRRALLAGAGVLVAAVVAVLILLTQGGAGGSSNAARTTPPPATSTSSTPSPSTSAAPPPISPGSWTPVNGLGVAAYFPGVVVFDNELWMVTGQTGDTLGQGIATVRVLDPETQTWRNGPRLSKALDHSAVATDGKSIFVIGGETGTRTSKVVSSAVYQLSSPTGSWQLARPLPKPRFGGSAVWDGTSLIYAGGSDQTRGVKTDVWRLSGDGWHRIGAMHVARGSMAATTDGHGTTWLIGGAEPRAAAAPLGAVDIVHGGKVSKAADLASPIRLASAVYVPGLGPCVLGGDTRAGMTTGVLCFDAPASAPKLPPLTSPRAGMGAAILNDVVYVVGGADETHRALDSALGLPLITQ